MKAPNGRVTTVREHKKREDFLPSAIKCKIKGAAKRQAVIREKAKVLGLAWLWKLELIFFR